MGLDAKLLFVNHINCSLNIPEINSIDYKKVRQIFFDNHLSKPSVENILFNIEHAFT